MKNEIEYKGMQIIEGTNGFFTAYPSKYSAFTAKDYRTLKAAQKYLDKFAK